jgi:hypothetical protein
MLHMSATIKAQHPTNLSPLRRLVIRRPVLAFLVMAFGLA